MFASLPDGLALLAERAEMAFAEESYRSAPPQVSTDCGLQVAWEGGAVVCIASRVDVLAFNRVVGLGIDEPATEDAVDRIIARFRSAGVPRFFVHLPPHAAPTALGAWLAARGFSHHNNWVKLWRETSNPPPMPPSPRIERIGPERGSAVADVLAGAYGFPDPMRPWLTARIGRPGWRHYVAYEADLPIACASMRVEGEVAWFGFAATRGSHRGHGAQTALIVRRIHEAAELGCRWLIVETAEDKLEKPAPSFRNLRRVGFEVAYVRPNHILKLPSPAS